MCCARVCDFPYTRAQAERKPKHQGLHRIFRTENTTTANVFVRRPLVKKQFSGHSAGRPPQFVKLVEYCGRSPTDRQTELVPAVDLAVFRVPLVWNIGLNNIFSGQTPSVTNDTEHQKHQSGTPHRPMTVDEISHRRTVMPAN